MASDFTPGDKPTDDERDLIAAIEAGRDWWPEKGVAGAARTATIRAALIRAILVGLEVGDLPSPTGRGTTSRRVDMLPYGLRIRPSPGSMDWIERDFAPRVSIVGVLNLNGLVASGGLPLPPLVLEFCAFDRLIDMAGLAVASLSLKGGRFSALRLSDAMISGPLDLSWCGPYLDPRPDGEPRQYDEEELASLWPFGGASFERDDSGSDLDKASGRMRKSIDPVALPQNNRPLPTCIALLDEMHVDGGCSFAASRFVRAYTHRCPFRLESNTLSAAVRLAGSCITGTVDWSLTVVIGGVMMKGLEVSEDIWFQGARIIAYGGQDSIDLQGARIGGIVAVRSNVSTELARQPELAGRLRFGPSVFLGAIKCIAMRARDVWIGDCILFANTDAAHGQAVVGDWGPALTMTDCEIGNGVWLGGYGDGDVAHSGRVFGEVTLNGTRIGGSLQINMFGAPTANEPSVQQLLPMATDFVRDILGYASTYLAEHHALAMEGTTVGNAMLINNSRFVALALDHKRLSCAIDMWKADITKSLQITGQTHCRGSIRLNRARVGRLLAIQCETIEAIQTGKAWPTAISAEGVDVDGEFRLDMRRKGSKGIGSIVGAVKLGGMQVKGDLDLKNFTLQLPSPPASSFSSLGPTTTLSLEATEISGRLQVGNIGFLSPVRSAASAASQQATANVIGALIAEADDVSVRALPWLSDYVLIRTEGRDRFRHILFDRQDRSGVVLSGQSPPIHDANAKPGRLDFGTDPVEREKRERGYLAFFCDSLQGDESSFRLVADVHSSIVDFDVAPDFAAEEGDVGEAAQPAPEPGSVSDASRTKLRGLRIGEFKLDHMDAERSSYFATVLYGEILFTTQLSLSRTGMVDMLDDRPVGRLKTKPERDAGAVRPASAIDGVDFIGFGDDLTADEAAGVIAEASGAQILVERATKFPQALPPLGVVDLRRMRCGFLADDYGRGWAMDERLVLRLFGVHCDMVDPTGGRLASGIMSQFGRATGNDRTARRLDWLRLQFSPAPFDDRSPSKWMAWQSAASGWLRDIDLLPRTWSSRIAVNEEVFAPQPWDMFAMAHIRAGEAPRGRELLKDRKDIEARLLSDRAQQWLDAPFGSEDGVAVQRSDDEARPKRSRGAWFALLALCALVIVLGSMVAINAGYAAYAVTAGLIARGVLAVALIVLVAPWLGKFWAILFRTGFSYGLSVPRALVTFAAFIVLGASATHKARTGDWISNGTVWADKYEARETMVSGRPIRRLRSEIALVLATGYSASEPEAPATAADASATTPVAPSRALSAPGTVVYALAAPCNLGVSSILYAADVFIPVLDLDQEARCTIREEPESERSYFWWSAAKTIYEILGWIVTSLVILTITGVMRRDMER